MVICLETATNLCSVALCDNSGVIGLREGSESKSHASQLTVFIDQILKERGIRASDLDAVAVSKGPGSYTGLRIGVSVAKGIAFSASIPLIAIDTTLSMFHGAKVTASCPETDPDDLLYCPMLDAKRMEIYYAVYDHLGNTVRGIDAKVIDKDSFSDLPANKRIIFFGDGASKCMNVLERANICLADDFRMSAAHMHKPVMESLKNRKFEDVAYFEPFYLKDFITTKPKKNVLGQ